MKAHHFASLLALLTAAASAADKPSALIREPGSVYFEDLAVKPVKLATAADAAVHSKPGDGRWLGTIPKGRQVEIIAIHDNGLRVRGQAQQGGVVGWVHSSALPPLRAEFTESLRQNAKRKAEVDTLIEKGEVALNMTQDEVSAALGKAQKKTSKLDGGGRKDVWEFVRYTRVPQTTTALDRNGQLVRSVVYVKVPSGKLTVSFDNNLVTSLEQTEGNTDVQLPPKVIAAPIIVPL